MIALHVVSESDLIEGAKAVSSRMPEEGEKQAYGIQVAIANYFGQERGAAAALPMKSELLCKLRAARATAIDPMQFVNLSMATLDTSPDEVGAENFHQLIQKTFEWIDNQNSPGELLQIALQMKADAKGERTHSGESLPNISH